MSLVVYSKFYFGHTIDTTNKSLDFSEGGSELQATLNIGSYTLTEFLAEIKRAMESVGALVYTVTASRSTRIITIASTSNFELLVTTGTRVGTTVYTLIGFTGADQTGAGTYDGDAASGSEFKPQFFLQDHTPSDRYQEAVDASVNESASGQLEVIQFGTRNFVEMNIRYQTDDSPTAHTEIRLQANAVANLITFMQYITGKKPVEYMEDEDIPTTFEKLVLEKLPISSKGTGFKLIERVEDTLPGYFDTGVMQFRVQT